MKNQAEIYQALLEGKALRCKPWAAREYIRMIDGFIVSQSGGKYSPQFSYPSAWEVCTIPKRYAESLKEALQAKKLRIEWPDGHVSFSNRSSAYWSDLDRVIIDLAIRTEGASAVEILE